MLGYQKELKVVDSTFESELQDYCNADGWERDEMRTMSWRKERKERSQKI